MAEITTAEITTAETTLQNLLKCNRRAFEYWCMMSSMVCSMLSYPDLWDKTYKEDDPTSGIEIDTLVQYAMIAGISGVAFSQKQNRYVCGRLSWATVRNDNGIAKRCILNGRNWTEEFDTKDVAYYRNYYTQNREGQLLWFAQQFADTDTAQKALIRHSRYTPMPVACTDVEKREYEEVMKRNINGEDITVLVRPSSNPMLQMGSTAQREDDRILNLSDPTMIEKMHFLSEYHAELKKRFAAMYGMCFKNSSKSAQESVDEVHSMDNFSLIIPFLKLASLKEFADRCKKIFGWAGSETVDFSELWRREDQNAKQADNQTDDQSDTEHIDEEKDIEVKEEEENENASGDS